MAEQNTRIAAGVFTDYATTGAFSMEVGAMVPAFDDTFIRQPGERLLAADSDVTMILAHQNLAPAYDSQPTTSPAGESQVIVEGIDAAKGKFLGVIGEQGQIRREFTETVERLMATNKQKLAILEETARNDIKAHDQRVKDKGLMAIKKEDKKLAHASDEALFTQIQRLRELQEWYQSGIDALDNAIGQIDKTLRTATKVRTSMSTTGQAIGTNDLRVASFAEATTRSQEVRGKIESIDTVPGKLQLAHGSSSDKNNSGEVEEPGASLSMQVAIATSNPMELKAGLTEDERAKIRRDCQAAALGLRTAAAVGILDEQGHESDDAVAAQRTQEEAADNTAGTIFWTLYDKYRNDPPITPQQVAMFAGSFEKVLNGRRSDLQRRKDFVTLSMEQAVTQYDDEYKTQICTFQQRHADALQAINEVASAETAEYSNARTKWFEDTKNTLERRQLALIWWRDNNIAKMDNIIAIAAESHDGIEGASAVMQATAEEMVVMQCSISDAHDRLSVVNGEAAVISRLIKGAITSDITQQEDARKVEAWSSELVQRNDERKKGEEFIAESERQMTLLRRDKEGAILTLQQLTGEAQRFCAFSPLDGVTMDDEQYFTEIVKRHTEYLERELRKIGLAATAGAIATEAALNVLDKVRGAGRNFAGWLGFASTPKKEDKGNTMLQLEGGQAPSTDNRE